MTKHRILLATDEAALLAMQQLAVDSHLVVTGQIGCGKTTLAREIGARLGLQHLEIDRFHHDANPNEAAAKAAGAISGGWVAEANVWQIPPGIWENSDLVILLDYPNVTHYLRILRRCLTKCARSLKWSNIRGAIRGEFEHLKIIYLYANQNRKNWGEPGGLRHAATTVIRSASPRATSRLLAHVGTVRRTHATVDVGV